MPLTSMPGRCGPRIICLNEGWDINERIHDAQRLTKWIEGEGVDPEWMVDGLRELGWIATLHYNCTIPKCVKFLKDYKSKNGIVLVDYWDNVETSEGHWAKFKGVDENGNPWGINPDFPNDTHYTWPRRMFEISWYDYTIGNRRLVEGVAIFAYKESAPKKTRKKKE